MNVMIGRANIEGSKSGVTMKTKSHYNPDILMVTFLTPLAGNSPNINKCMTLQPQRAKTD